MNNKNYWFKNSHSFFGPFFLDNGMKRVVFLNGFKVFCFFLCCFGFEMPDGASQTLDDVRRCSIMRGLKWFFPHPNS